MGCSKRLLGLRSTAMLTLKLYPTEFRVLIQYLRFNTNGQDQVPLVHQTVGMLLMINYLRTWTTVKLLIWSQRRTDKEYKLSIPLPVALALYRDMQSAMLAVHQLLLLAKIDQAIISYRDPMTQAHTVGELINR